MPPVSSQASVQSLFRFLLLQVTSVTPETSMSPLLRQFHAPISNPGWWGKAPVAGPHLEPNEMRQHAIVLPKSAQTVGAGRASGALAFELVTFAKSHIALLGGPLFCLPGRRLRLQGHWGERFEGGFWEDFWLRFAFIAMQVSVLAEFLCFRTVFDLILFRLQGQGVERFGVYLWCVFDYAGATWSKMIPYSLQHSPKITEVGPKMAPT